MKILILCCVFSINCLSQLILIDPEDDKRLVKFIYSGGGAIGPETKFGLPRIDGVFEIGRNDFRGKIGGGASVNIVLVPFGSVNGHLGLRYKHIVIENNFSKWVYYLGNYDAAGQPRPEKAPFYITYNPKVGFENRFFNLKIGPSYLIKGDQDRFDNNVGFNLEGNIRIADLLLVTQGFGKEIKTAIKGIRDINLW